MTSDDLCNRLVAHFNALASKPINYQAVVPAEVAEAAKETSEWKVFVTPFSESEEPIDRGDTCREEYVPSVVVNGPLKGTATKAKGAELVKFLRDSLRETEFENLVWDGNEVVSLYDADALKTKQQFLSLFRPTYYTFA